MRVIVVVSVPASVASVATLPDVKPNLFTSSLEWNRARKLALCTGLRKEREVGAALCSQVVVAWSLLE
uniref:Putative secreted protein n=1 Tax=Ixodes ricinus TaxID=34613 RepID=A0A6B0TZ64_IXORI